MKPEIDPTNYAAWLFSAKDCKRLVFQNVDFTEADDQLVLLRPAQKQEDACTFLGCTFGQKFLCQCVRHFGVILPSPSTESYRPFRHALYSVEELFAGFDGVTWDSYRTTVDWRTYTSAYKIKLADTNKPWFYKSDGEKAVGLDEILARRLHDNSMEDALAEFLTPYRGSAAKGIVGVMGGHDKLRQDPQYAQIAHIAHQLTKEGYLVVTGGGPGLMEAANLGAFMSSAAPDALDAALQMLQANAKAQRYDDEYWLQAAWEVREQFLGGNGVSMGIPTWFYGHEPPNVFASHIAKYFENSLREEGLLRIASNGLVVGEGNGGTVQEIFQDACQNYYATYDYASPVILIGQEYWNSQPIAGHPTLAKAKPLWPLLQVMAKLGKFENRIKLTDSSEETLAFLRNFTVIRQQMDHAKETLG
jgi:predicted Rossmann-fold nucleotide-binding protein